MGNRLALKANTLILNMSVSLTRTRIHLRIYGIVSHLHRHTQNFSGLSFIVPKQRRKYKKRRTKFDIERKSKKKKIERTFTFKRSNFVFRQNVHIFSCEFMPNFIRWLHPLKWLHFFFVSLRFCRCFRSIWMCHPFLLMQFWTSDRNLFSVYVHFNISYDPWLNLNIPPVLEWKWNGDTSGNEWASEQVNKKWIEW